MAVTVNPNMVTLAREYRRLTQKELSEKIGITQGALSKVELGLNPMKDELLDTLSRELDFPITFFLQEGNLYEPVLYYRKKYKTSKKILTLAKAEMNIMRIGLQQFLKCIDLDSPQLPHFDVDVDGSPDIIANKLREYWHLSRGPIRNLVSLLESKGIVIIYADFESDDISGSGMFTLDKIPIIFVNKSMPMDRKKFTICHELFHILAHINSGVEESRDVEKEADLFASEFLIPSLDIRGHLIGSKLTISKLADLKRHWGMSMQALLMVAKRQKVVSERHYKTLWMQLSKMGYRKNEPPELEPKKEMPMLLNLFIQTLKNELEYTDTEIANILNISEELAFEKFYNQEKPRLKVSLGGGSGDSIMLKKTGA